MRIYRLLEEKRLRSCRSFRQRERQLNAAVMVRGEAMYPKLRAPTERLHGAIVKMLLRSIIRGYAASRGVLK